MECPTFKGNDHLGHFDREMPDSLRPSCPSHITTHQPSPMPSHRISLLSSAPLRYHLCLFTYSLQYLPLMRSISALFLTAQLQSNEALLSQNNWLHSSQSSNANSVLLQPRLSQHRVNEEDVREKTRSTSDPDYAGGSYGNQSAEGMEKRRARLHAELTKLGINPDEIQSNPDQFGTSTLRTYNSFIFPKSSGALAVAESPTRAKVVANSMSFLIREYKADRERWIRNVDQQRNTTSNNSVKHSITVILDNVRSAPNVGNILRVESVRLCG